MPKEEKRKLNIFLKILIALGVVFIGMVLLGVVAIGYLIKANSLDLDISKIPAAILSPSEGESSYDHPLLDEKQEVFLESVGVDTTELPTQITKTQEDCSVEALGQARVNEILGGSAPSPSDYFKAKHCF